MGQVRSLHENRFVLPRDGWGGREKEDQPELETVTGFHEQLHVGPTSFELVGSRERALVVGEKIRNDERDKDGVSIDMRVSGWTGARQPRRPLQRASSLLDRRATGRTCLLGSSFCAGVLFKLKNKRKCGSDWIARTLARVVLLPAAVPATLRCVFSMLSISKSIEPPSTAADWTPFLPLPRHHHRHCCCGCRYDSRPLLDRRDCWVAAEAPLYR